MCPVASAFDWLGTTIVPVFIIDEIKGQKLGRKMTKPLDLFLLMTMLSSYAGPNDFFTYQKIAFVHPASGSHLLHVKVHVMREQVQKKRKSEDGLDNYESKSALQVGRKSALDN